MEVSVIKNNFLSCPIYNGSDVFIDFNDFLNTNYPKDTDLFILVDENTEKFCLSIILSKIDNAKSIKIIQINSGEKNKTIETAVFVWKKLMEADAKRNAILINLGGGVICDLGGFIASLYKRGISFINIPTTLMAQVDAGFGGKTGIDFNGVKNQIGTFALADAVFIYPEFIKTLNKKELLSGFAEIIKYSLISNDIEFNDLLKYDISNNIDIQKLVINSIAIKSLIVSQDYKENNIRKILNFGHTIGHAIEAYFIINNTNTLLHGEAIAIGMICELYLSVKKLNFPIDLQHKYNTFIIEKFGKSNINSTFYEHLIELMRYDKKNSDGEINFVLLKNIGEPLIDQKCSTAEIVESLDYYNVL